jgi:hypothetical protein
MGREAGSALWTGVAVVVARGVVRGRRDSRHIDAMGIVKVT